ncbi:hypothetical protein UFOVP166_3 [uncultured Caudovirales phage]|uniref:Uncharacterized protein n=1 Tax=uncultured Caudovirales phage TaxID=2100421 RepID=A0A6J7WGI8_9CAUD|nr:hypothetical protein UFOVP166_3 [uncultured Caudovirales phage]
MDLNKLKPVMADEGAIMQVRHPETEDAIEGMTITLLGQDSGVYKKILLAKQQAALSRISKGKKAVDLDATKLGEDGIDDLVKLTVGWEGFTLDGKKLDATPENVRMVYSDWNWLREQAQEFVADRAHFFR